MVVLDSFLIEIWISESAIFSHLEQLKEGLLTTKFINILVHDFLMHAEVVILLFFQLEEGRIARPEHLLLALAAG